MSQTFYLPISDLSFSSKAKFSEKLKEIKNKYRISGIVTEQDEINILIDFASQYHPDKENILKIFDLNNCEFFVAKSEQYKTTECFHIKDLRNPNNIRRLGYSKFTPPTVKQNFTQFCRSIIEDLKLERRLEKTKSEGKSPDEYNLWHKTAGTPFKDLIDEFIARHQLTDKLENVITPNGTNVNVPQLQKGYEYLKDEFLKFYIEKYPDSSGYILKAIP